MVVDHQGLFIYLDFGYPRSYHVMSSYCANLSCIRINIKFFMHDNHEYFEYLLKDPSYLGKEMFIMKKIGRH